MLVMFFMSLICIIILPVAIEGNGSYEVIDKLLVGKENTEYWAENPGRLDYGINRKISFPS
jgi:hypothetical protein